MTFVALRDEVKNEFCNLANSLSPENVSHDGELSRTETIRRYRSLTSQWKKLERDNEITVTEDEVWDWLINSRSH